MFIVLFSLGFAASGCQSNGTPTLTITGSSTMYPLVNEIGKRFERDNPNVRINVQSGGSSRGIADTANGLADIGMSSRFLRESEKPGRKYHVLARDGVCFIVNKSNPVPSLTRSQLIGVMQGKIRNWKDVGGIRATITFANRAAGRSEVELVTEYFGIKTADFKEDLVVGENQHGIKTVAADPHSILYISVGTAEYEAERGVQIKLLPLENVPASVKTVQSGSYPLSRPLILVSRSQPSALAQRFLDFALSTDVHDLVRKYSFVPAK